MKRFAFNKLIQWKNSTNSNTILVTGADSVGKTTLVKEFAATNFDYTEYINAKADVIKLNISQMPLNSVVILDNITGKKDLISQFNQLAQNHPSISFIYIDKFIKLPKGRSGSIAINHIVLRPLSFEEFLLNTDYNLYLELINGVKNNTMDQELNTKILKSFKVFLFTGGMPQVVQDYIDNGLNFKNIREIQFSIITGIFNSLKEYFETFEYKNLVKTVKLILPSLLRDNKKFKISDISASTRFVNFKKYFEILEKLHFIHSTKQFDTISKTVDEKSQVLYFFDTGLLGALDQVPESLYFKDSLYNNPFTANLSLNFIACELYNTSQIPIYYWTKNMSKVEFIISKNNNLYGIEFKDDSSGKLKSLDSFIQNSSNAKVFRVNQNIIGERGSIKTYPLYLVNSLFRKII